MASACPRCRAILPSHARYCPRCGLPQGAAAVAGRVGAPDPRPAPAGFSACDDAVQLYFRAESAYGGRPLIGTEGLRIELFNAGYGIAEVEVELLALDAGGTELFSRRCSVDALPSGQTRAVELPSYELPSPIADIRVRLVSAAFLPES